MTITHRIATIQVLFFAPGQAPEVRTIENTLEAKQALVEGLITTFDTGVPDTIGIANDEELICDMPLNRHIPATGAGIFGPFLVASDAPGASARSHRWSLSGCSICSAPNFRRISFHPSSRNWTAARSG